MSTPSKHRRDDSWTQSVMFQGVVTDAAQGLDVHMAEVDNVRRQLETFIKSIASFGEQSKLLMQALQHYGVSLTSESDPEIIFARKGALKLHDLVERFAALVATSHRELEERGISPMDGLVGILNGPRETKKALDKAQSQYEVLRKKHRETVASKKATPAKIREAQDELDAARIAVVSAEKEAITQCELSNAVISSQCPRLFSVFYKSLDRLFKDGAVLLGDAESYYKEFQKQVEHGNRSASISSEGQSLQLAQLLDTERKTMAQVSMLVDICNRMIAEQSSLHVNSKEIASLFPGLSEMYAIHASIVEDLEKQPTAPDSTVASRVAASIMARVQSLAEVYVPFTQCQTNSAPVIKAIRKSKGYAALAQHFDSAFATVPGGFDVAQLLAQACRHVHQLKFAVQALFDKVPTEDRGWGALHDALESLTDLLDKLDDARVEGEHVKQLQRIKELLPDLDEGINDVPSRTFLYDSDITVASSTGNMLPPPQQSSSSSTPMSPRVRECHGFLFNDYFIIAEREPAPSASSAFGDSILSVHSHSSGGSSAAVYRSVAKLPLYHLTVEVVQEPPMSFRVSRSGSAVTFTTTNDACHTMWTRMLRSAISERQKTQVFGVPLFEIMRRPSERGRVIPRVLEDLLAAVESREQGMATEGIYRVSGRALEIAKLVARIDAGKHLPALSDPHSLANLLKLWLRMIPDSLLCSSLYNEWCSAKDVKAVKAVVAKLPPAHVPVLAAVIQHLRNVAKMADRNMMTPSNLAIVFLPSLLRGPSDVLAAPKSDNPVELLMNWFDEIFEGDLRPKSDWTVRKVRKSELKERVKYIRSSGNLKKWEASAKFLSGHRESLAAPMPLGALRLGRQLQSPPLEDAAKDEDDSAEKSTSTAATTETEATNTEVPSAVDEPLSASAEASPRMHAGSMDSQDAMPQEEPLPPQAQAAAVVGVAEQQFEPEQEPKETSEPAHEPTATEGRAGDMPEPPSPQPQPAQSPPQMAPPPRPVPAAPIDEDEDGDSGDEADEGLKQEPQQQSAVRVANGGGDADDDDGPPALASVISNKRFSVHDAKPAAVNPAVDDAKELNPPTAIAATPEKPPKPRTQKAKRPAAAPPRPPSEKIAPAVPIDRSDSPSSPVSPPLVASQPAPPRKPTQPSLQPSHVPPRAPPPQSPQVPQSPPASPVAIASTPPIASPPRKAKQPPKELPPPAPTAPPAAAATTESLHKRAASLNLRTKASAPTLPSGRAAFPAPPPLLVAKPGGPAPMPSAPARPPPVPPS